MAEFNDLADKADESAPAPIAETVAPGTDIAVLEPKKRALIVLKSAEREKDLRALVAKSVDIKEVKNDDGRDQAHRMAMNLRNARTTITKTGKEARDDANAFCSAVIAEEKRLLAISETEEKRVFKLRDDWDAKVKAEAAERERKEQERKDAIHERINGIAGLTQASVADTAEELAATIADLEEFAPSDEDFAEFAAVARQTAATALAGLRALHAAAASREALAAQLAEQARQLEEQKAQMAAQQAELDRQKAELAEKAAEVAKAAEVVERAATLGAELLESATPPDGWVEEGVAYDQATDGGPNPDYVAPEGWDRIEGDTPITPEVHARESRIPMHTHDVDPAGAHGQTLAPLNWDTSEQAPRQPGPVPTPAFTEAELAAEFPATFSDAGLARVAAAVALQSAPEEVWTLLEDGELLCARSTEDGIRSEARLAMQMAGSETFNYSIARYVLAKEFDL
ncbi:MAG TPA: hypothetical protein VGD46_15685 [Rhizobacter sp.]